MFEDKYSFTQDQNRRFAKMNLTRLVFTNSRFEGGEHYTTSDANNH